MSRFRLQGKNFFLTYPRCDKSPDQLADALRTLWGSNIKWYLICQEPHKDRTPHLHATIGLHRKYETRNHTFADFLGHHGSYETTKDIGGSLTYCGKERDWPKATYGDLPEGTTKRKWSDLQDATDEASFMDLARSISPRDYYLNHSRLRETAQHLFKRSKTVFEPRYTTFKHVDVLADWYSEHLQLPRQHDRPKSLIIVGPSKSGKTAWARSLGRHMYFNGRFNINNWDDDAQYAIFDDFADWSTFHGIYKQFLGAQFQFDLTGKYARERQVTWGKPTILLSNDPITFPDPKWIDINCVKVTLTAKLY